jgi:preprotein translocase subunit SecE
MSYFEWIKNYFKEVRVEMSKVKWPTKNATVNYTLVVIGVSAAVAMFLGALDYFFGLGLNFFLFK